MTSLLPHLLLCSFLLSTFLGSVSSTPPTFIHMAEHSDISPPHFLLYMLFLTNFIYPTSSMTCWLTSFRNGRLTISGQAFWFFSIWITWNCYKSLSSVSLLIHNSIFKSFLPSSYKQEESDHSFNTSLRYFPSHIFSFSALRFYLPQNTGTRIQFNHVLCHLITRIASPHCPKTRSSFLSETPSARPFLSIFL